MDFFSFLRRITRTELWYDLLALLGLVAMVIWFCDGMLFFGKVPFFRDLGTYTYPIKYSLATSLQAGELGLWDRHIASGFPLLAGFQPGIFYPFSFVFYFLPLFDAIRFTFFLHFVVAVSGAYVLCRWWKFPVYISAIGAILFTLGGTTVSLSNLLNHFQTAVWLPWMILCWERVLESRSWKNFLIFALLLLSALLAGSPEIYLFSLGLLVIDGVRIIRRDRNLTVTRMGFLLIGANILVAAIGMAQFLPTFELVLHSRRDRPLPLQEATLWSLQPASLLGLFFPDKDIDPGLPVGIRLFFSREVPFLLSHYLGVISLLGVSAWMKYASWKERTITLSLISASLILAFGRFTPVYSYLFDYVPLFRIVRFPEKFFFLTYAFLILIVLRGLFALHDTKRLLSRFPVFILFGILTLVTVVYSWLRSDPESLLRYVVQQSGEAKAITSLVTTLSSALYHLERQIGVTLALLLLFFCRAKKLLGTVLLHGLLVAVIFFDLGSAHKPLHFLLNPDSITKTKRILSKSDVEGNRLFYYPSGQNLHPSYISVFGWPPFEKAVALSFDNLLPNVGVLFDFDYFQEIDAITRQPYNDFLDFINLLPPDGRVNLLRAVNVRYVVSFRPIEAKGLKLSRQFPEHFSWLYEIAAPLPRAYVAASSIYEPQTAKTLRMLSSAEFDPLRQVILNERITTESDRPHAGVVQIARYENETVLIKASLSTPGVLVLTDSYYPGWKVFVDGKEMKILQANHFFRGVELAAGDHVVEFKYEPLSFRIGSTISLSTLFLLTVISLFKIIRWRKRFSEAVSDAPPQQPLAVQQE